MERLLWKQNTSCSSANLSRMNRERASERERELPAGLLFINEYYRANIVSQENALGIFSNFCIPVSSSNVKFPTVYFHFGSWRVVAINCLSTCYLFICLIFFHIGRYASRYYKFYICSVLSHYYPFFFVSFRPLRPRLTLGNSLSGFPILLDFHWKMAFRRTEEQINT